LDSHFATALPSDEDAQVNARLELVLNPSSLSPNIKRHFAFHKDLLPIPLWATLSDSSTLTYLSPPPAGSLAVAAAAIAKDKVTNLPGFGAPLTDMYSG
jgi:hypothetical protein